MSAAAIPMREARAALPDLVARAHMRGERTVVSKNGRNVAAIVSMADLELLQRIEDRIDIEDAREAIAEAERDGVVPWDAMKRELGL